MLTRRDLVSNGLPLPFLSPRFPTPHLLSVSPLLSFSDPQALNDFLHGSEKVSAGVGRGLPGLGNCGTGGLRDQCPDSVDICLMPSGSWALGLWKEQKR